MREAVEVLEKLYETARQRLRLRVTEGGKISAAKLDREQLGAHALAYLMTEYQAVFHLDAWSRAVAASGAGGVFERHIAETYAAELVRSLRGGIDLGQTETIPLSELGLGPDVVAETIQRPDVAAWADAHTSAERYLEIANLAREKGGGALGLDDDTLVQSQREFRKFVDREVKPIAQEIHRKDILIPLELVQKLSDLGVFGLTIPEAYGGLGLGKIAMCVVTEELSRGYIGVGSLGTRAEIAAELILGGGTEEQKKEWLPRIASGEVLPTAVFTEPNNGSDLAHIQTRAVREGGAWRIRGQKTWITHACRADLMTLLARSKPDDKGYGGLSMFLAPKTRTGTPGEPEFVDAGLTGTEIKVLGYRGMKEYELSFDGFAVPEGALLGGAEGQGFKQLMATFESARIQTAARGVGVAQAALEEALSYAQARVQFGRPIFEFPRVARKIARMVCRIQPAWRSSWRRAPRGSRPTRACRSTGATASPRSTRRAACSWTRASCRSSRARTRSRRTSSRVACSKARSDR
jgi:(2S)-methylsuccinyl-CoA dehydrogenase